MIEISERERVLIEMFRNTTEAGRFEMIQAVMNIWDKIEAADLARQIEAIRDSSGVIPNELLQKCNLLTNIHK